MTKRCLLCLFAACLFLSISSSALAEEEAAFSSIDQLQADLPTGSEHEVNTTKPIGTVFELYASWNEYGYPDDVCGVYSADGSAERLVIELLADDELRQNELRACVTDPHNLQFGTGTYTYNDMLAVQAEITEDWPDGMYAIGLGLSSEAEFGASGMESRVVVSADERVCEALRTQFAAQYGGIVYVEMSDPIMLAGEDSKITSPASPRNLVWLIVAAFACAGGLFLVLRRRIHKE